MSNPSPSTSANQLQMGSGNVLTVGTGMEFATLADAVHASHAGDTIAVQSGTYVNDFVTVTNALRIVAVGGMVNEVATVPPPNGKALITVDANLSIQGFNFTGGSDGSPYGNISGIRLEFGSLNVSYCYFHDMQEGLLAGANPAASVVIDHSEFARNGAGDGYSHNLYVGAVGSLTITNSYFHDAVIGHEIKSRAAVTTISNNVIADGPNGTASYCIDLPNAGVARITNNLIEKGPNAANHFVVHYGGELQFSYATNSFLVGGNTVLNDQGSNTYLLLNQSAANGNTNLPVVHDNFVYGFTRSTLQYGGAMLSNNVQLAHEPGYSTASPWQNLPSLAIAPGPQSLSIDTGNHTVSGGVNRLSVTDSYGFNTINGGAGGIAANVQGWDRITTQAGAADSITLVGRNDTVTSAGADRINAGGYYHTITATGQASITGSGYNLYALNGAGERLTATGSGVENVGAAGDAIIVDNEGQYQLGVQAGGRAVVINNAVTVNGGAASTATITVGAATGSVNSNGSICIVTGDGGARVQAGTGSVSVSGGLGADTFVAGSGSGNFTAGGGADRIVFGSGQAYADAGSGADSFVFQQGASGADTISGYQPGTDTMVFQGFSGSAVASDVIANNTTVLTLTDGTVVTLLDVALPQASLGNTSLSGGASASMAAVLPQIGHMDRAFLAPVSVGSASASVYAAVEQGGVVPVLPLGGSHAGLVVAHGHV